MKQGSQERAGRPRWLGAAILAAVLVALVIVALLVPTITNNDADQAPDTAGNAQAPVAEEAPEVAATGSTNEEFAYRCQEQLSTETTAIEDSAPEVDEWVSAGYNVVPTSAELGGCEKRDSGLRVGYAHTAAGALMAAANYAITVSPSGIDATDSIKAAVADGSDRDQLLEQAEQISKGNQTAADPSALRSAEFTGYDVREATGDEASFNLYLEFDDASGLRQEAVGQVDLVWEDGDWKVEPASGQDLMSVDLATSSPSVAWGP